MAVNSSIHQVVFASCRSTVGWWINRWSTLSKIIFLGCLSWAWIRFHVKFIDRNPIRNPPLRTFFSPCISVVVHIQPSLWCPWWGTQPLIQMTIHRWGKPPQWHTPWSWTHDHHQPLPGQSTNINDQNSPGQYQPGYTTALCHSCKHYYCHWLFIDR